MHPGGKTKCSAIVVTSHPSSSFCRNPLLLLLQPGTLFCEALDSLGGQEDEQQQQHPFQSCRARPSFSSRISLIARSTDLALFSFCTCPPSHAASTADRDQFSSSPIDPIGSPRPHKKIISPYYKFFFLPFRYRPAITKGEGRDLILHFIPYYTRLQLLPFRNGRTPHLLCINPLSLCVATTAGRRVL